MEEQKEYLDAYEERLIKGLVKLSTGLGRLSDQLLASEDIDDKWEQVAQPYMGDAVKEIAKYPTVSLGWMMYVGMAVAHYWDDDWQVYGGMPDLYTYLRDKRGFDCLDEYVREEVLGLQGQAYDDMEEFVRQCATMVLTNIRHEQVEPQSARAFHLYVRSIHALYLVGAAVEMKRLGYKMDRI